MPPKRVKEAADATGCTSLHRLCYAGGGSEGAIVELLAARANVNRSDRTGWTPLHYLCCSAVSPEGKCQAIETLVEARASVSAKDRAGKTPLVDLCLNPCVTSDMMLALLRHGAEANAPAKCGDVALHSLCMNAEFPSAWPLLQSRADVNALGRHGLSPLHVLCDTIGVGQARDGVERLHELLDARADPALVSNKGMSALDILCQSYHEEQHFCDEHFEEASGRRCLPPALESAARPLLLAAARPLQGGSLEAKVEWFRSVLSLLHGHVPIDDEVTLSVTREGALQRVCDQLHDLTPFLDLDSVIFEGEHAEGPGVLRELFTVVAKEFANEDFDLFSHTGTDPPRLALSTRPCCGEDRARHFEMIGGLIGLALRHEQHFPVLFARPLLKRLLGAELCAQDLADLDPELHRRLAQLRALGAEVLEGLELDFTLHEDHHGKRRRVDLVFGGADIKVTEGNLEVYLRLYARQKLEAGADALQALVQGLHRFCPAALLEAMAQCFSVTDLDALLSGPPGLDVEDWREHTKYQGSICPKRNKVVLWFWAAVRSYDESEQRLLLRFATGRSSAPIGGFKHLKTGEDVCPFTIALKERPKKSDLRSFFPTAATCGHLLQLPRYDTEEDLRRYMKLACQEYMMGFSE